MNNSSILNKLSAEDKNIFLEMIGKLNEEMALSVMDAIKENQDNLQKIVDSYKMKKEAFDAGDLEKLTAVVEEETK